MFPNDNERDSHLEKLIADAKPTLDTVAQSQIAYSAGWEAGRQRGAYSEPQSGSGRWALMASHALCALAASWMTFAWLPARSSLTPGVSSPTQFSSPPEMAQARRPHTTDALALPEPPIDILNPRMNPTRLVEFLSRREKESTPASNPDDEPILNSRSIIF